MMMHHQNTFGSQGLNGSEDIAEKVIFCCMSPCCDLDLEDSKLFFPHMTLWFMMLHHHTMFGHKMFCGSEDIIWTNIHQHFEPLLSP